MYGIISGLCKDMTLRRLRDRDPGEGARYISREAEGARRSGSTRDGSQTPYNGDLCRKSQLHFII